MMKYSKSEIKRMYANARSAHIKAQARSSALRKAISSHFGIGEIKDDFEGSIESEVNDQIITYTEFSSIYSESSPEVFYRAIKVLVDEDN